jgi:diguanylate cyclase (GGDEF)-like protein
VVLSIAIAVAASMAALWIARWLADGPQTNLLAKRVAAACVMGVAITGMHYTGNAAAHFVPGAICGAANGIDMRWLATTVTLLTLAILTVALMLSRFEARTAYLTGSVTELSGQVLRLATSDVLTGLANRRALAERLEAVIAKARRRKTGFALLFMDLDGFKTINDSLGHTAGDEVLRAFGKRLLECVPRGDMVARLGGDEFVVLAEHASTPDAARGLAQAILAIMREPLAVDTHVLQIMPSIGIALFPPDGDSFDTLLKHADAAMYEAKRGGRGRFRFFEASMNEAAMRTFLIQHALQESLAKGYFSLHFQPKFASRDGALTGAEALLRLEHPKLGRLTPAEFIPIAERSGQIVQIGYWVVLEACRQIVRWRKEGLPPTKIAINLSPKQLAQDDLVATILDIVRSQNVSNEELMFEITETVAMHDARRTVEMVHAFQENGFEIAIDDFGTGYSSLAYLQRFRVRQLKIDRFFVDGLDMHGPEGSAIVSAIIALAHSLDMRVVAEGVETASQRDQLQALGCDQMQGFLLGKPEPADTFAALLRGWGQAELSGNG